MVRLVGLCLFLALVATSLRAEIFVPGETVPGVSGEVFTWDEGDANSTFAFWDDFDGFPGGSTPGGIVPGTSPAANSSFAGGGTATSLTFDSFATIVSSGNAYGFNFADTRPFQPEFVIDAFSTVRSGTAGGDYTRIVAQWQTQGTELAYDGLLLSLDPAEEGTIAPSLSIETGRDSLGGFGELITRLAVWDLETSQEAFRFDFRAQANHMSLDQFRVDTFNQDNMFGALTAIPEPGFAGVMLLATSAIVGRRGHRR